jgi:hypothetical protein
MWFVLLLLSRRRKKKKKGFWQVCSLHGGFANNKPTIAS